MTFAIDDLIVRCDEMWLFHVVKPRADDRWQIENVNDHRDYPPLPVSG
eukprot:CAMPEP_0114005382 /NCGR_PEP_ID=MMETSP0372-20130328/3277_1 /TAXON_ID=340204 /ORGANISM="Lankesteria abbotti" /LENGTH=47 /assembly_acc=CAM_ASM_000359